MYYCKLMKQAWSLRNRLDSEYVYHILWNTIRYGTFVRILQNKIQSETDSNVTHIHWNVGYPPNVYSVRTQYVSVSQWLQHSFPPWQKGFAIEGKSVITIRIPIHIVYIRKMSWMNIWLSDIYGWCRYLFGIVSCSARYVQMFRVISCSARYNTYILIWVLSLSFGPVL